MDGLFQIVKKSLSNTLSEDDNVSIIGTAFAIATYDQKEFEYYLLTAYHCVSESFAKKEPILIRDSQGKYYSVEVMFPKMLFTYDSNVENDFALLKLISNENYILFNITLDSKPCDCYIRGASDYYSNMSYFTPFKGSLFWEEAVFGNNANSTILILDVNTKDVMDKTSTKHLDQQIILGGMSGSPIIVEKDNKFFVAGIYVRVFGDGSASKCYGVPITTVVDNCLMPLGLYSFVTADSHELQISHNTTSDEILLCIDSLFKNSCSFSLEDCSQETELWDNVSNKFYGGYGIDKIFDKFIYSKEFSTYSLDVQIAIRYCLAKLLFKRNKSKEALLQFTQISKCLSRMSPNVEKRMSVLMAARTTIECIIQNPQHELDQIRFSGDKIINLNDTNNIYNANELASITGKGLTNFFGNLNVNDYSHSIKYAISEILELHTKLLQDYPIPLQKQDVVNTSLRWLTNIWSINGSTDENKLYEDAKIGFEQSLKRKNSIFYIQSMTAYAISLLLQNENSRAINSFFIVVMLLHMENISMSHEGIRQLFHYLKCVFPQFYMLIELYYKYSDNIKLFTDKASLYSMGFSNMVLGAYAQRAQSIVKDYYIPLRKNIFLANTSEVIQLL